MQEKVIGTIQELLTSLQNSEQRIFGIGCIYANAPLLIHEFIPGFEMITCYDPFDGRVPNITVPKHFKTTHKCTSFYQCQHDLLRSPDVLAYVRSKTATPRVFMVSPDEESQKIAKENNLSVWCGPYSVCKDLQNKVVILGLVKDLNIPFIQNVCSKIKNYEHLKQISKQFQTDKIVIQSQCGISGMATYFIFGQEDYNKYAKQLQNDYVKKIMPFKRLKSFGIGAVTGKFGTVIGPLHAQVIGHKKLTPYRGGFCANEMRSDYFQNPIIENKIRKKIYQITKKFGDHLYKQNIFRGMFGIDFVVDYDTFDLYLMQVNPRMTGSTTISYYTYQAEGIQFPFGLFHFAEYMDLNLDLPIEEYNKAWEETTLYQPATHIPIKPFNFNERNIDFTGFPPGLWRKTEKGFEYTGNFTWKLREMTEEDILFIPNRGFSKGNIIMKKKCQQFSGQLTKETQEIIDFFLSKIEQYAS